MKVQGARQASTQFGEAAETLVWLAAPSERVLEGMLSMLYANELTKDTECLWAAKALGSYVRATPQQVDPATPEMYAVSRGLLHLLGHKNLLVRRPYRTPPHATASPPASRHAPPCIMRPRLRPAHVRHRCSRAHLPARPHVLQVRDAAISSVCDLAKVNKELATSLAAEAKPINKQLAEKLDKAVEEATAHYTAVELGSPHSS